MLEWLNLYRADIQHVASLMLGLAMWRFGAGPERAIGVAFGALVIVPALIGHQIAPIISVFGDAGWLVVVLDSLAAAAFIGIALHANRNYPLWVAALQLVAVSAHAVRGMVDAVSPIAYLILAVGPSYGQLVLLLSGFVRHWLRARRFGPYRDWRAYGPGQFPPVPSFPRAGPDA